ncbi:hypothetical protein C8035_v011979 [Colletotrichum spinosum]|uniref:Uncharacterized protein n=1 Tax=Colletotrichum spinosum TaxID=1347390 RepID=A0A4R8PT09_9PEZI|nr:hypothetical protein C8035_v011979 [Colletotrichum spinosum]
MSGSDSSDNFFVRFKQRVDDHIAATFQSVLGIPNAVTRNLNGRWPEPLPSRDNEPRTPEDRTSQTLAPPSSQFPQPTVFELFSAMSPMQALLKADEVTESLYQAMWISFLIESPYSPLHLRDMPQPTPKDIPEGADPTLFGFEDAFEDLLMVSSGQSLPDINERHRVKKEWRDSFPRGLPPILWLHQLTRQGLWDGWAPKPDVFEGAISERWQRWLREQDDPFHDARALPPTGNAPSTEETNASVKTAEAPEQSRSGETNAETEEDSYFSVMGRARVSGSKQTEKGETLSTTRDLSSQGLPPGWRVVEKVQERDDGNGNTSVTKTVKTFNDKGEEVGRQTEKRSEKRSDYTWSASFSTGSRKKDQARDDDDGKGSWFWK